MNIYVLQLEGERLFLYHSSHSTDHSNVQIMLEAEIYYDYLKKYKPISIITTIQINDIYDIDKYVKQYMTNNGIEYVRGGTYFQEILPDYLEKTLQSELETVSLVNRPNQEIINSLINNYAYREFSKEEIQKENNKLTLNYQEYMKEKILLDKIKINGDQILGNIDWLRSTCSQNKIAYDENKLKSYLFKVINNENKEKYKQVLNNLRTLYSIFKNEFIDHSQYYKYKDCVYTQYPQFIFDDFFYHWHRVSTKESIEKVEKICNIYEHITNIIINRMDEKKFDLESFDNNIEWSYSRAIYLLDKIKSSTLCIKK